MSRTGRVAAALLVGVVGVACSSSHPSASKSTSTTNPGSARLGTVPGSEWEKVSPASQGLDASKLDTIAKTAQTNASNCLAVVRNGKLADEWYFRGTTADTPRQVFSATKSFTSTLIGIAQDEGKLRITDSASRWIPEWRGTPAQVVTVRDLLSNDSGREWSLRTDYVELIRAKDQTAFAVSLRQTSAPGTVWAYNNSAIQTLQRVLRGVTGEDVGTFAQQHIFGPLGMRDTTMSADAAGNTQTYTGIRSTCRDMARFGLMVLDHGRWGNRQIVSSGWLVAATGASSTPLNAAYGYLWWLNRAGVIAGPLAASDISAAANRTTTRGQLVPGAPVDMFWAIGLGNQIVQIDPGSKTVVVRLGAASTRPRTFAPKDASRVVTEALLDKT
ncbi:MAG TPA: serine hydrolase [Acidimicrobiia bacterium]|jgi:CubicO group peptidase (beta-lactamase class C family)